MGHVLRSVLWFALVPLPVAYGVPTVLALIVYNVPSVAGPIRSVGLLVSALGTAGLIWCFSDFVRLGHGTPAPYEPPRRLVAVGLYRCTRNPMYVSVLLIVFGEAIWWANWMIFGYTVLLWGGFQAWVVFHEEPALRRRFGGAYERYTHTVPRWIGRPKPAESSRDRPIR